MKIISSNLKFNGALTTRKSTKNLILHHAAATKCSVEDIHRWHLQNGWAGIGYNYLVRKDGSIYTGRPENAVGAHTYGQNYTSIGICFEGNFEIEKMPDTQKKAGQELVYSLKKKYPNVGVKRHKDFGKTACPGKNFPFDEIKNYNPVKPIKTKEEFEYKNNILTGVKFIKTPIENFQIVYWDGIKRTALHKNYCNAGFFCDGGNGTTSPVANLAIDGKVKSQCYNCPSWHNFYGKKVSTFVVTKDNRCDIRVVDRIDDIPNLKYAISGLPVTVNYDDVHWSKYVKPQGWFGNELRNTKHICLGYKDGYVYIFGFSTYTKNSPAKAITEIWKKLKPYGLKDIIMLDGGGSYCIDVNGKNIDVTAGNRRVNTLIKF